MPFADGSWFIGFPSEVGWNDRTAQTFIRQTIIVTNDGVQLKPFGMHYRWPEQIDDLATQAGLRLDARYADWHREPFGPESRSHVSVYRKP